MSKYVGGGFLVTQVGTEKIFSPEAFTSEQKEFAKTTLSFIEGTIAPRLEEIEEQKPGLVPSLLKKAGELGLLMIDIPEKYGGLELDKATSMLVAESMAKYGSFSIALAAHTGIGTLPIVFFGNEQQKAKYLPDLAAGKKIAAYALTEPNAGSDALSIRTKATLSEDGKYYILEGTKQFITNAGFADIFIIFAKIDGTQFTGFIVEANSAGLSTGQEEKKLGLKGSSTRTVILEGVKVPVENLLGEIGKGHKIAFNILNIGRFKLGIAAIGACKYVISDAVKYANERKQFNQTITSFPAIKEKIAKMVTKTYVGESMSYRIAGYMDERIAKVDKNSPSAQEEIIKIIEEYAIEDSIMKVFGSEVLDFVVDEAVQIHGGYGYTQEYPAERAYRDSRINRIFEGTNEINRLLVPGTAIKRAMQGGLPLMAAAQDVVKELISGDIKLSVPESPLSAEVRITELAKKSVIYCLSTAVQKYAAGLQNEQEILIMLSDMMIYLFGMDSVLTRALQRVESCGSEKSMAHIDIAKCFVAEGQDLIAALGKRLLSTVCDENSLKTHIANFEKAVEYYPLNIVKARRNIAAKIIEDGKYQL